MQNKYIITAGFYRQMREAHTSVFRLRRGD